MMNATERARRSDSLYYDTYVTSRRALCDMIANLESDLGESRAENTKLRNVLNGCAILLTDNQFLHWPELREATLEDMRELGIEVNA